MPGVTDNPASQNRYIYCLNNPLGLVDPDGNAPGYPGNGSGTWQDALYVYTVLGGSLVGGPALLAGGKAALPYLGLGAAGLSQKAGAAAQKALGQLSTYYTKGYHKMGGTGGYSKFATSDQAKINALIEKGLRARNANYFVNSPDSYRIEVNFGYVIGTEGQTGIRIIVADSGKIINAFPIKF